MSIFIDNNTKLIVQGITGRDGSFHAKQMIEYGTKVVAGVTPGKGGQTFEGTVPIFDTVYDAVQATGANTSVIYVPPMFAADAMMEAAAAGVKLIVCITEGVPVLDMTRVYPYVKDHGARLIGPNCPGLITPGQSKVGIIPGRICMPGHVGVVSRSGTLTYEIVNQLTMAGIGQSSCVGIGGDPINGTNFIDCLAAFEADPQTKAIAMMGEIGGTDEQEAAAFIKAHMKKPVVGFIAGQTAPPGRRMGHAGAIISGSEGTAAEKIESFLAAGMGVAQRPVDFVRADQGASDVIARGYPRFHAGQGAGRITTVVIRPAFLRPTPAWHPPARADSTHADPATTPRRPLRRLARRHAPDGGHGRRCGGSAVRLAGSERGALQCGPAARADRRGAK